jgi:hypothetical protein
MNRGDVIVYRCLAGYLCDAEVRAVRLDGRADLAIDAGGGDPVELTRIEVCEKLVPGTCADRRREGR